MIPYGRQSIDESDIEAVVDTLQSAWITQGPMVPEFERAVARYVDARHAVAVTSGTAALHLACLALDLGPGGLLWTVPNTFVASANCARYCGADVDFVDIDPRTYNLSIPSLSEKLEEAAVAGRLPDVLVPVHFGGHSCDMEAVGELASRYGFKVIEDASHAFGGDHAARKVGCCQWSDLTVFSFHPVKIITTGEGGMITTNDDALLARLARLRSHGITRADREYSCESHGPWYYEQIELGYNYRMTDIQAALGVTQLSRVDRFIDRRREIAEIYEELLAEIPLQRPRPSGESAWHLYVVGVHEVAAGVERGVVFAGLRDAGIGVQVHYIPVHLQPYYRALGFHEGMYPGAELHYSRAISLPMSYTLRDDEQRYIVDSLADCVRPRLRAAT